MQGNGNKHTEAFKASKLKSGEQVLLHLEGWIGEMMGKGDKTQRNGQFILTNERACFYRKGMLGEVFETIPLSKITSVESISRLGYRCLRLHTSHDELAFKTFEAKDVFDSVYDKLEEMRHAKPDGDPRRAVATDSPVEQLKNLKELLDAGILNQEEFAAKKAEILARL